MQSSEANAELVPAANSSRPEMSSTIETALRTAFAGRIDAASLIAADGRSMSFEALLEQIHHAKVALRSAGVGPQDRVAVVLPNGPTLAALFIGVAGCAGCAPLNSAHSEDEYAFYFHDLKIKALITIVGTSAAEFTANALKIPIIVCREEPALGVGRFTLHAPTIEGPVHGEVGPDSCALYLYTSGTTSKPKLVPLRHRNLVSSALNMVETLQLTASDRCLNLMPLFHIHGLVGGLLAPLMGGGAAVCPPSLRPGDFFRWMQTTQPTWYTAVPTMHRSIVNEASNNAAVISRGVLRFIRSSSAPMPVQLFDQLVQAFGVPVLEAYSMTEAAHQMTCNPLGARQKPGTVGRSAGPDVGIMDGDGYLLPSGEIGEVVIRGPSVMSGYEANPDANAASFSNGWFRTGDQGRFDDEGYLTLTGRLKEQINRGGEKLSPLEIDQILLAHPGVMEAATFGFPHPTLGEEVAAAVVLRPKFTTSAVELQDFLKARLSGFKVPRRILIVEEIPKSATGKIQRGQLHKQLGLSVAPVPVPTQEEKVAANRLQSDILRLWRNLLQSEAINSDDDFFESGGDSLMAISMIVELEKLVGRLIPESILIEHPTVSRLAKALSNIDESQAQPLIYLQQGGSLPPLFFFHGDYDGGYYTRGIARLLGPDQPFITVAPHGLGAEEIPQSISDMALDRMQLLLAANPQGPFRLVGYCNAGMVVLEIARRLQEAGREVDAVFLIDVPMVNLRPSVRGFFNGVSRGLEAIAPDWERRAPKIATMLDTMWRQTSNFHPYSRDPRLVKLAMTKIARLTGLRSKANSSETRRRSDKVWRRDRRIARTYNRLFRHYVPLQTQLKVIYFEAEHNGSILHHLGPNVEVIRLPGGHWGCVTTHADVLVGHIRKEFEILASKIIGNGINPAGPGQSDSTSGSPPRM